MEFPAPPSTESTPVQLSRIETKLDFIHQDSTDHEKRLRSLERALWIGIGLATTIGSAVGSLIGQLVAQRG